MKTYLLRVSLALSAAALVFAGCQKDASTLRATQEEVNSQVVVPPTCGNSVTRELRDLGGNVVGTVQVSNDETNYYLKVTETIEDYNISKVKILYGTQASVASRLTGQIQCGLQEPVAYDLVTNYNPEQTEVLVTIPIATINLECPWFNVRVNVARRDLAGNIVYAYDVWTAGTVNASQNPCQELFEYCTQDCPDEECGQLRTQTPGGWGAEPNGNNPGTYLHNNFAASFPTGLKVGCAAGFEVTLTSAQAITNLLPTGGQPAVLTADYTNPASLKNVLVGHVVALTLSVKFDIDDPDFGEAGINLGDMEIGSGTFEGMTVNQFLAIANNVLGGCSNAYTASQIQSTIELINENYTDGLIDNGFLVCP